MNTLCLLRKLAADERRIPKESVEFQISADRLGDVRSESVPSSFFFFPYFTLFSPLFLPSFSPLSPRFLPSFFFLPSSVFRLPSSVFRLPSFLPSFLPSILVLLSHKSYWDQSPILLRVNEGRKRDRILPESARISYEFPSIPSKF